MLRFCTFFAVTLKQILLQRASNDTKTFKTISFEISIWQLPMRTSSFSCSKTLLDALIDAGGATEIRWCWVSLDAVGNSSSNLAQGKGLLISSNKHQQTQWRHNTMMILKLVCFPMHLKLLAITHGLFSKNKWKQFVIHGQPLNFGQALYPHWTSY